MFNTVFIHVIHFGDILLHPTNTNNIHQEGFVVIAFIRTIYIIHRIIVFSIVQEDFYRSIIV